MGISSKGKRGGAAHPLLPLVVATASALLFSLEEDLLATPEALASLLKSRAAEISTMKAELARGITRPEFARLRAEIDAAAHQKDAAWSGLYWYTSLPEALAAAKRESKPILSLRLLGRLDEELSCANSRFFRTALYSNEAISLELRDHWILHWESVRPAPRITIDFGDGRTLVRTITGNSLHYVLDAEGRAHDVIPGLWGPGDFLRVIRAAGAPAALATADVGVPGRSPAPHEPFEESLSSSSSLSLDSSSLLLMRTKAPRVDDAAFRRMVVTFERTLAEDTQRNRLMRERILPWLAETTSLAALTDRIYRDAFLTPRTDPWLGLVTPDAYTAIEGDPAVTSAGPDALRAGTLAVSKVLVERPQLAKVAPGSK